MAETGIDRNQELGGFCGVCNALILSLSGIDFNYIYFFTTRLRSTHRSVSSNCDSPVFHIFKTISNQAQAAWKLCIEHFLIENHIILLWERWKSSRDNSSIRHARGPRVIAIDNGNRTEWSPIRSVIIRVITKLDDREAGVQFVNHEYYYRPTSDDMKSHYQLIISKGGLLTNQIRGNCDTFD